MNAPHRPDRPDDTPGGLIADLLASVSRLVQGELALLRAETTARTQAAQKAIVLVLLAVVLGITALNILAGAAVMAVAALGLAPHWATLIVGVAFALAALAFASQATARLRAVTATPSYSAQNIRRDVETLQTLVKNNEHA